MPYVPSTHSSTRSFILVLALAIALARPLEVMSTWKCGPVFNLLFFFFLCCLLCSVFNHSQLIIETSVGLNGLCACLTYFKMYLQIKGRPNHRPECWCVRAVKSKSEKRKTFVVNNFDVNRLVAEFNQKQKRKNLNFQVKTDCFKRQDFFPIDSERR